MKQLWPRLSVAFIVEQNDGAMFVVDPRNVQHPHIVRIMVHVYEELAKNYGEVLFLSPEVFRSYNFDPPNFKEAVDTYDRWKKVASEVDAVIEAREACGHFHC